MTPEDWHTVWTETGLAQPMREGAPYQCRSRTQIALALRNYEDAPSSNPDGHIDAAIGESLMEVDDSNGEVVGYWLHPGVNAHV